jgi:hypothetical protein
LLIELLRLIGPRPPSLLIIERQVEQFVEFVEFDDLIQRQFRKRFVRNVQ